jgi:pimeloyl-ACP methyl ester carboxylesterase
MEPPLPDKHLVLIPALFCDDALYAPVKAELAKHATVHVIAAPRDTMEESVAAILEQAPQSFVVAGTSYGASLAIEVALAAQDRVKGLWIMGSNAGAPDPDQSAGLVQGIESNTEGVIGMLAGVVAHPSNADAIQTFKDMAARVGPEHAGKQAKSLAAKRSVEAHASTLGMPVLAIWGAEDKISPPESARGFVADVPNAEWHEIAGCGHLPTLEKPAEVAKIAGAWLDKIVA